MNDKILLTKYRNSLSLPRLVAASIISTVSKPFVTETKLKLPVKIEDYKLVSKLKKEGNIKQFALGVYVNSKGEKAMAKMWQGKIKNFYYYSLRNESVVYHVLNRVVLRIGTSMPKRFRHIYIPKHIKTVESSNTLLLLTEYVKAMTVLSNSGDKNLELYFKIMDYLNFLGKKLTKVERTYLSERSALEIVLIYPLLLLAAARTYPKTILSLVKSIPIFLRSVPLILKRKQFSLIHRDLHARNLLRSGKNIVLLDLEFCLFSDALFELVIVLRKNWGSPANRARLMKELKFRFGKIQDFERILRGLTIKEATHALTNIYLNNSTRDDYLDCLNSALKKNTIFSGKHALST